MSLLLRRVQVSRWFIRERKGTKTLILSENPVDSAQRIVFGHNSSVIQKFGSIQ